MSSLTIQNSSTSDLKVERTEKSERTLWHQAIALEMAAGRQS